MPLAFPGCSSPFLPIMFESGMERYNSGQVSTTIEMSLSSDHQPSKEKKGRESFLFFVFLYYLLERERERDNLERELAELCGFSYMRMTVEGERFHFNMSNCMTVEREWFCFNVLNCGLTSYE